MRKIAIVLALVALLVLALAPAAAFAGKRHGNQKVANSLTATQTAPAVATSGNATAQRCDDCEAANGAAVQNNPNLQAAQANGGAARNNSSANGATGLLNGINQENNQTPALDFEVET